MIKRDQFNIYTIFYNIINEDISKLSYYVHMINVNHL